MATNMTRQQYRAAMAAVTPAERTAEARRRLNKALNHIESAQNQMAHACAELSTLVGVIPVWRASSNYHDSIKALWYRTDTLRVLGKYKLDDTHVEVLALKKDHGDGSL